jgi:hypothetical protein
VVSLLEGSLAATIGRAFTPLFLDAVLTRDTVSSNSPDIDSFDPPPPTSTDYTCKAIVENYRDRYATDTMISERDRKVLILATSLALTPIEGDRVTIRGITFTVLDVVTDPAIAVWECRGRM